MYSIEQTDVLHNNKKDQFQNNMSLSQIDLRAEYNHGYSLEFNQQSWSIAELYWSCIRKYNTEKVKKCIIRVSDGWKDKLYQYTNWADTKGINLPFSFDKYFSKEGDNRKKIQLEIIHDGMLRIAEKEGWEKEPLIDAYNKCLEVDLLYQFDVGKLKSSPNRKHKIGFWCNWDIDVFEVFWVLYDKKGEEIHRGKFITKEPYEGEFIYYVKYKWLDNDTVLLEDKYKYGNKETWTINATPGNQASDDSTELYVVR